MTAFKIRARQRLGDVLFRAGLSAPHAGTLTILMYHAVTSEPIDDERQMSVGAERFASQMAEVRDSGVQVLDLADGVVRLRRGELRDAAVSIVFDDGFVGVHDHAANVLSRHGYAATAFVTTSWIGQPSMPQADKRLGRPLTWREVQALHRAGISVGSHTHTHPRLSRLSEDQIRAELRRSRETIADQVGCLPDSFAYPFGAFGSFDERTRAALGQEGFHTACTTVWGRNDLGADALALKRIRVSWCDDDGEIRKSIAGCYDWYRWVLGAARPDHESLDDTAGRRRGCAPAVVADVWRARLGFAS